MSFFYFSEESIFIKKIAVKNIRENMGVSPQKLTLCRPKRGGFSATSFSAADRKQQKPPTNPFSFFSIKPNNEISFSDKGKENKILRIGNWQKRLGKLGELKKMLKIICDESSNKQRDKDENTLLPFLCGFSSF